MSMIGRRAFVIMLSAALALRAAKGQPTGLPVIGFLNSGSERGYKAQLASFRAALHTAGYDEGRNVLIEFRWADGQYDQLAGCAADLVRRNVAVIVANGPAVAAAKAATTTIPILFSTSSIANWSWKRRQARRDRTEFQFASGQRP